MKVLRSEFKIISNYLLGDPTADFYTLYQNYTEY